MPARSRQHLYPLREFVAIQIHSVEAPCGKLMDHARLAGSGHSGYEYTLHPELRATVSHGENTGIAPTEEPRSDLVAQRLPIPQRPGQIGRRLPCSRKRHSPWRSSVGRALRMMTDIVVTGSELSAV